ncbi:MAG: NADPH:quinone reductase [Verrucomicrobia subdivision 3 bacterium]|nr:NADPH:quinone reductase [Limisphaerales bacterium]
MKAAFFKEFGPPDKIIYGDLPQPKPGPGQYLVKVAATDVNPIDTYIRSGLVKMDLPLPYIIGCSLAGTIAEAGPNAKRFKPGDRVWGSNQGLLGRQGASAEFAVADECWLYPTPKGVSDEDVAAIALVGITAHLGLVRDAKLRGGEVLFVNGGSGGVGSAVVQMAKALGASFVITTAGNDEKVALCKKLGADLAINYKSEDVDAAIRNFAPEGVKIAVNVWWETLREPDFDRAVNALGPRGRIILMAGRDARPQFPVGPFYVKGCSMYGFAMFNASAQEQRAAAMDISRWMTEGKLRANIGRVLPLSEAAAAHQLQEENTLGKKGTLAGKIVLRIGT